MSIETTYFVGAGASKAIYPSLPLASEMTLEYLLDPRGSSVGFDQAIDHVEKYMANQCWPSEWRLIPFEQIYLEFPENLEPLYPRENLEVCLFRKLRIEGSLGASGLYYWLQDCLHRGHPILTTNYDTVIEWDVENLPCAGIGFGESGMLDYGVPNECCLPLPLAGPRLDGKTSKLLLLKLYGSMSWCRCESCRKYLLETIYERGAEDAIIEKGKCTGCAGTRRSAVFVPLVGQKSANDTALRAIWKKAEQVLSESQQIVFAGFSLNPDDLTVRELLARAFSAGHTSSITVVLNGNHPETIARYRRIYSDRVELYESGWVRYLSERKQEWAPALLKTQKNDRS